MAAVLACGPTAALSHGSAAALWGVGQELKRIEVSVLAHVSRAQPGIQVHRRSPLAFAPLTSRKGIPVTTVACTLVDLAAREHPAALERAINEADKRELADPEALRASLQEFDGRPGVRRLRDVLNRHTFVLTDSELERLFLPIARSAGMSLPLTGAEVNGFKVDFFWPDLGLVVETDGLRYHRTPAAQACDRLRDQAHIAAGLTPLRFTHHQVRYEPGYVRTRLAQTARQLSARPRP
jgi:hypothetical protein